jgi:hypothetical protein
LPKITAISVIVCVALEDALQLQGRRALRVSASSSLIETLIFIATTAVF